jgi:transposase InsO family protein
MGANINNGIFPKNWPGQAKSILIHVISMARIALIYARARCIKNKIRKIAVELQQAADEINLLKEELRIKDARLMRISPNHRPHYIPTERLNILELKAARGWSDIQAAEVFLVCPDTIAYWSKMLDDEGPKSLVRIPQPVNKLPNFVRYIVGRLKILCPAMGKVRIAQALTKAGLSLGASTVGRILKDNKPPPKEPASCSLGASKHTIHSRHPNNVWNIDLTIIPTSGGFWISWLPNAITQVWPFCWWLACILDQYSRCVIGFAVFRKQPTAKQLRDFLKRAICKTGCRPKHIITDKGTQFKSRTFRKWCRCKGITLRYGAVGRYGSIAIIERFFRTLKTEWLRRIIIPLDMKYVRGKLTAYIRWYNFYRPHQGLGGSTPAEIYNSKQRKKDMFKFDPEEKLRLIVSFYEGDRQLPIIKLKRAA